MQPLTKLISAFAVLGRISCADSGDDVEMPMCPERRCRAYHDGCNDCLCLKDGMHCGAKHCEESGEAFCKDDRADCDVDGWCTMEEGFLELWDKLLEGEMVFGGESNASYLARYAISGINPQNVEWKAFLPKQDDHQPMSEGANVSIEQLDDWSASYGIDGALYGYAFHFLEGAGATVFAYWSDGVGGAEGTMQIHRIVTDPCHLPVWQGSQTCESFDSMKIRYAYDPATDTCDPFPFNGCEDNTNNFVSREACRARCLTDDSQAVCPQRCHTWWDGCKTCTCEEDGTITQCNDHAECKANWNPILSFNYCLEWYPEDRWCETEGEVTENSRIDGKHQKLHAGSLCDCALLCIFEEGWAAAFKPNDKNADKGRCLCYNKHGKEHGRQAVSRRKGFTLFTFAT